MEAWSGGLAGWRAWWLESGKLEIGGLKTAALDARPEAGGFVEILLKYVVRGRFLLFRDLG